MTIFAFAGPSLPPAARAAYPHVTWLPPAAAGDLLRLRPERPQTICLIDGFFDHRPAVRHKEILLLLSEGIRIFGAASIGALRSAEMSPFGMIGIGSIHAAYAGGRLTADDEVALAHGPAEWDWRPLSVPMVDVRATLLRAVRARILAANDARRLRGAAAAIHYADREWAQCCADAALDRPLADSFSAWLRAHPFSQKEADARACLAAAAEADDGRECRSPRAVRTSFLTALAADLGVKLDGSSAAAAAGRGSSPGAPASGTGGG